MGNITLKIHSDLYSGRSLTKKAALLAEKYKRIMLIKEPDIELKFVEPLISELKSKGAECIIFDKIGPRVTSRIIDEIEKLVKTSFTEAVIGFGGFKTLSIARITAAIGNSGVKIDDVIDDPSILAELKNKNSSFAYAEIVSSVRYPFLFTGLAAVVDGRIRKYKVIDTFIHPSVIVRDSEVFDTLGKKITDAVKYEILMNIVEGLMSKKNNIFSSVLYEKAAELLKNDGMDFLDDSSALSDMGMGCTGPGCCYLLAGVINSKGYAPKAVLAALLVPHFMDLFLRNDDSCGDIFFRISELYFGRGKAAEPADFVSMIREEISAKDLPMRLSALGVRQEQFPAIAENFIEIYASSFPDGKLTEADISELLKAAF